uniref:MATH domain-containing protein n=1 Tax=Glycine max TaxID=3847 RepID=K7K8X8_SOYBN|eukprot:XP_006575933.1 ubiquitin carboxyl-terminal hydrolase 12 [Glycine max]
MDNENAKDKIFEKFTWRIRNFSTLDSKPLYSEEFFLDNHTWSILIYPKGNKVAYLSIYLDAGDPDDLPHGRRKYANFKLALVNQVHDKYNDIEETSQVFSASETNWGFTTFTPLNKLCDPSLGFIVNDTCIIQVQILANKSKHENQVDQSVNKIDYKIVERMDNPLPKEMISTSFGGLVDFRGLGKLEEDFVPLLEEVCSRYPSLIDSMQKRSQRFIEWAFTALGRVLHFLKTKNVMRDMDEDAYNHLQILWEELETCV